MKIEDCINTLGEFCGRRDLKESTQRELQKTYGYAQADLFVLFGGSILEGVHVLAQAIQEKVAKKYIIVGGAGHTTETLRQKVRAEYPMIMTEGKTEAELFEYMLEVQYGLHADELEIKSTNCGNNITYLLELLKEKSLAWKSIILTQDATMQLRMELVLEKYMEQEADIINYAAYQAHVIRRDGQLTYQEMMFGMWDIERYVSLLMGEIPRLTDNETGYGPKGKGYLVHVDIPDQVRTAFEELKRTDEFAVREANPEFASVEKKH